MVTTTVISNGKLRELIWDEETKKWYYTDSGEKHEEVDSFDLLQISLENQIAGMECLRKKISGKPDKSRKFSVAIQNVETALYWLRAMDYKKYHAVIG